MAGVRLNQVPLAAPLLLISACGGHSHSVDEVVVCRRCPPSSGGEVRCVSRSLTGAETLQAPRCCCLSSPAPCWLCRRCVSSCVCVRVAAALSLLLLRCDCAAASSGRLQLASPSQQHSRHHTRADNKRHTRTATHTHTTGNTQQRHHQHTRRRCLGRLAPFHCLRRRRRHRRVA